jgi:hypothetical protein
MAWSLRSRTLLILPAVMLTVALLEDVAMYKLAHHIRSASVRAALDLALFGVAFAVGAEWLTPWIVRVLTAARRHSRREAGSVGIASFYAAAYGGLYWLYVIRETHGVRALLPAWLR